MTPSLKMILEQKQKEVGLLRELLGRNAQHPIHALLCGDHRVASRAGFKQALDSPSIAIIAEIKRQSPSKGTIAPILDPVKLAQLYESGGANALSILTDTQFFGGHLKDLMQVANHRMHRPIPILRKDFIIDTLQIAEAVVAGASAVLCIVAVLGKQLKSYLDCARALAIEVLVEVHDRNELSIALDCGAEIIGINNRNLKTFAVDTNRASELISHIPKEIITVAESGITQPEQVQKYYSEGFKAVLIGEALVRSSDPAAFLRSLHV